VGVKNGRPVVVSRSGAWKIFRRTWR